MRGEFWLAGPSEEQRVSGTLEYEDGAFLLTIQTGAMLGKPRQITVTQGEASMLITHNSDPANVVADHAPRTVHGTLDDGILVTLIDAHMSIHESASQIFRGHRAVHGAHLTGPDPDVQEVRWAVRGVQMPGWHSQTPVKTRGGEIGPGDDDEPTGLAFRAEDPGSLRTMTERLPDAVDALVSLWTAREAAHDLVRLRVPDGTWCGYEPIRAAIPHSDGSSLLPSGQLDLSTISRWIELQPALGQIPFITIAEQTILQSDAHLMATALEGLHRRLYRGAKPFKDLGSLGSRPLKEARSLAVRAAMDRLAQETLPDLENARQRFTSALSHINEPSYSERLKELLTPVLDVAPGLVGPSVGEWIKGMTALRNDQSHQLDPTNTFEEDDISEYYVLSVTARWALRIRLLLELVTPDAMSKALHESITFAYALAHVDKEGLWRNYSALATFRNSA